MRLKTILDARRGADADDMSRLLRRVLVGGLFVGHGLQKLTGMFGGGGPKGTGEMFESVGLRPGKANAIAAGAAETIGGGLLVLGLATPAAVAATSGVMITAMRQVHLDKGIWVTEGGVEYTAVLLSTLFGIAERGPGLVSLDRLLGTERTGVGWALGALAAGAAASTAAVARARRRPDTAPAGA
jgi:putative oxidoreductase